MKSLTIGYIVDRLLIVNWSTAGYIARSIEVFLKFFLKIKKKKEKQRAHIAEWSIDDDLAIIKRTREFILHS